MTKPQLVVSSDTRFSVPVEVAICPYCKRNLTAFTEAWEEDGEVMVATEVHTECEGEPAIDSDEWPGWFRAHSYMPYVYQLPVNERVADWVNSRYRFKL